MKTALVIGAGPAGLMAAEELARAGWQVTVAEAKPSPARKFLMAGKSGLNLTRGEPLPAFTARYPQGADWLAPMLAAFGPAQVQDWARGLGQEVFTGSTGRVFPVVMKGSPLLRAWLARLSGLGVVLRTRWRWTGFQGAALAFDTPDGPRLLTPDRTILALGGASWPRLGSDAAWVPWLAARGVVIAPFHPSNAGLVVDWSPHMARHFGAALKGIRLTAADFSSRGEVTISARGLEGGGLYPLTPALRDGAALIIDLMPDTDAATLAARLTRRGKDSLTNTLRKAGLDAAKIALAQDCARPLPTDPQALARRLKALPIPHKGPRPMDEAISTAGGIRRDAVDDGLQLRALPGIYAAGEMLDWDAPTGGYLLTASLASGRWAGRAAAGVDPATAFST
ncbi:TIGR03862 family flavoprotein [Gemmobacter nectariphilus]|uniref:TIGR03862 family flavoprotein n=1 Tax=Gemmobacter nectariphilus TaxID=220343 RepID=UPI000427A866|nr:TIGR03862 family flavoprotein [Gemmobacter nectariphilus]